MTDLARPGQIGWSGQNWYEVPSYTRPSTVVVERTTEDEERAARRRGRRVPFGFGPRDVLDEVNEDVWEGMGL